MTSAAGGAMRETVAMWTTGLRLLENTAAADWLVPRMTGELGTVAGTIPDRYPAYARVCHPAGDVDGGLVSWAEVAAATGRRAHPLMQWHAIVGTSDYNNMLGSLWPGAHPRRGHLVPEVMLPLCELLAAHTTTPGDCYFCLWEGWGWIHGAGQYVSLSVANDGGVESAVRPLKPAFSDAELNGPRVQLPARDYLLFAGSLSAIIQTLRMGVSTQRGTIGDQLLEQSPNLFWPADQAWCVATEVDFDSTLVAGSTALNDQLLATPGLEAWPVEPRDGLHCEADLINAVPSID